VSATGGSRIANATVKILDGPAARSTTTNSNGEYAFDGLTSGNANLSASATIYDPVTLGVFINGTNTLNFTFPVPACQTNNTAQVNFENVSVATTQNVFWDGVQVTTLAPGQNQPPDDGGGWRGTHPELQKRSHRGSRLSRLHRSCRSASAAAGLATGNPSSRTSTPLDEPAYPVRNAIRAAVTTAMTPANMRVEPTKPNCRTRSFRWNSGHPTIIMTTNPTA
jgi:hypothetical protein